MTLLAGCGDFGADGRGGVEFPYDRVHVAFDMMAA